MSTISPVQALLGLLARGEMYGYELKRSVEQDFAPFWRIDYAQLYRSLAKMKRSGWVRVRLESSPRGPVRKAYSITPQGRKELDSWFAQPARDRNEFFVKLALASNGGTFIDALIEAQRKSFEDEQAAEIAKSQFARVEGNASKLILAHAALKETEASLAALDFSAALVPIHLKSGVVPKSPVTVAASDDPILLRLAQFAPIAVHSVGSLGGLYALSQHQADLAGSHLLDLASGEYNIPFVRQLFPEDEILIVNLAWRETGLILAPGNPLSIHGVRDLARREVRLINRSRGTGTRLLLFGKLRDARIDPHSIKGWERVAATHDAVAGAITAGTADVGAGLRAVAHEWHLDFIALNEERYDLIIPRPLFESPRLRPILEKLDSKEFRNVATSYLGYDLSHSGRVIAQVK
jgi:molybdate-binding protein/DNA-binding PadR family transcriptional regulator